ncbi:MAG: hypothetical protein A3D31_04740 [Candidatus Fluviicola riflensis]|nr:MAG: hypothetical protein CHH17_10280 [Candidatus Fluviicola riflensis]OGS79283.1 MAG: hypothetical protein A3D31_04740 [Candidatus Fluviicola riflensis]OGS86715.1 MAG: hypothetical protein A2724_04200 [Fluviicola sp. RIFCSPHIGHO2_01_FULL_43_53]OGS88811.1 MAG: hypothetical protein A3E30_00460 [Fluviicola sp. RIFCSPHIGHO2_12_FULL_43_24]
MKKIVLSTLIVIISLKISAQAEVKPELLYSNKLSIVAGLIQPIALNGWNVELNYTTKRMIFDYSHGFNLHPPSGGEYKIQNVVLYLPYSTGFGIGYRINSFLDIRFEPKLHSWEVYYRDDEQTPSVRIEDYKTFTLGIGIYYRYFPFRNSKYKGLQGITTATSLRFWPNIGSTLSKDKFTYDNKLTSNKETQKAANIGMGNTPFIFNISIGYTFGGKD